MQFTLSVAALAATVSANVLQPRAPAGCATQITVSGGVSGTLGQLSDGQNRIGPYPPATYYLSAGGFTDQSNRGCILTPPTTQFQCDVGARPTTGFAIGSSGAVTSNGSPTFYACPAANGIYNIYTRPVAGQSKCVQVSLKASNAQCYAAAVSSSSRFTNSSTSARPSTSSRPASSSSRPVVVSTSTRPASTSTRPATTVAPATQRPATSASTSPRPAASPVAVNTCPPAKTVTVTAAAPAAKTVTVTAPAAPARTVTVCPSQAPVQAPAQSSARPATSSAAAKPASTSAAKPSTSSAAPAAAKPSSTTARAAGSSAAGSTTVRTSTATSTVRPQTPTTSPRAVVPTTTPRPVTPSTAPRPISSSTRYTNSTRPATATTARPASSCPALLSGAYQTPHLIVPVNSQSPARAYGTSYNGTITPTTTSDFNFDIPQSYAGKTCNLVFYFPTQAQLSTSSFTQSANGGSLRFSQLSQAVSSGTTFQNQPPVSRDLGVRTVAPGNAYTISTGACPAGRTVSYSLASVGGYSLNYFQDYNPCPIGLFITSS